MTALGHSRTHVSLSRSDLPAVYHSASEYSGRAQRSAVRWSAAQLILLGGGAMAGAADVELSNGMDLGALGAAVALTVALVPTIWLAVRNPQRAWYRGRAAAESVKTLSWKYAVRAAPFIDDGEAERHFAVGLAALRRDVGEVPMAGQGNGITPAMRRLRDADLQTRRDAYVTDRIDEQRAWYTEKAASNARAARWAMVAAIAATVLGIALGFLNGFGRISYDGLGAASAIAAGATAWMQLKQYRPLAAAYSLTASELAAVHEQLANVDSEPQWAVASASAEEAISREHTMWIARREAV